MVRRRLRVLIAALVIILAGCGDNDGRIDERATNEEWCQSLWEDDLAPYNWDRPKFMRDCQESLEAGFPRPLVRDTYEGIKAEGG